MAFMPVYILILFYTILVDYTAGWQIERSHGGRRWWFLVLSIIANLGVLIVFKYFNFFNANLTSLASFLHWNYPIQNLAILLPLGLSFHTFQSLSYTIEVYRGRQKAERHLGIFALYVMFYPQLVAGPIERPMHLLPQLHHHYTFDYQRVTDGLRRMVWGFFKKIVIADRLAVIVNMVYNEPSEFSGLTWVLATYFFAFQIYCDFSGYSDIAIGAAHVMGYNLSQNFHRPYFARSISEFWQRWHISLSTWFRDYLYIPLGGNRVAQWRWYYNLMIVFLVSGLWHGANWTFIVWGALHGFYMLGEIWTSRLRARLAAQLRLDQYPWLYKSLQILLTFHLVAFAWIFFRANSMADALYIVKQFTVPAMLQSLPGFAYQVTKTFGELELAYCFIFILLLLGIEGWQSINQDRPLIQPKPIWLRWALYYAAIFSIMIFGAHNSSQFIYFQF